MHSKQSARRKDEKRVFDEASSLVCRGAFTVKIELTVWQPVTLDHAIALL